MLLLRTLLNSRLEELKQARHYSVEDTHAKAVSGSARKPDLSFRAVHHGSNDTKGIVLLDAYKRFGTWGNALVDAYDTAKTHLASSTGNVGVLTVSTDARRVTLVHLLRSDLRRPKVSGEPRFEGSDFGRSLFFFLPTQVFKHSVHVFFFFFLLQIQ